MQNSITTADTAIGEIETSLGHVAGHINSLGAYQNTANALASIELESAAKLMDTNFALETAKLMKKTLIQNMLLQWWQKLMRSKKIKNYLFSKLLFFLVVYIFKGVMEMKNKQQIENKENNKIK